MPQAGEQQDALRQGPLCLQRLPHTGNGRHRRPLPCRNVQESHRDHRENDAAAFLPHARSRASCDGGCGIVDGIQERRRGY